MSVRPLLAAAALAAGALSLTAAPAAAAPPGFGTAPVQAAAGSGGPGVVRSVTVGRNEGFDRVVFTLSGPGMGYRVEYVPELTKDGSGDPVPLEGDAVLAIMLSPTNWTVTAAPTVNTSPGYPALRQVRSAGEFEATAQYGIGQESKAGFRVLRLAGPDRIVVDVAHPTGATTSAAATTTAATTTPAPATTTAATTTAAAPAPSSTAPTPAATSAASAVDPGFGRSSPVPAIVLGAAIALALLGAAALLLRVTRRPST